MPRTKSQITSHFPKVKKGDRITKRKNTDTDPGEGSPPKSPTKVALPAAARQPKSPTKAGPPIGENTSVVPDTTTLTPLRLAVNSVTCYREAKKALHKELPDRLLGRDEEVQLICKFMQQSFDKKEGCSMYISGQPGTGKTAVVRHCLRKMEEAGHRVVFVNCMTVRNCQSIFPLVLNELQGTDTASKRDADAEIERLITAVDSPMVLLVLDELDSLQSANKELLYQVFEWPHLAKSRLILIGIGNTTDFVVRVLPRLKAKVQYLPKVVHFKPYSKDHLSQILQDRLSKLDVDVFDKAAIELCARKIGAVSGDLRNALDICHNAIEKLESDVRRQRILQPENSNSPAQPSLKKVTVAHIVKEMAANSNVVSSSSSTDSNNNVVPLHQTLAVCATLLTIKKEKRKQVALGKLHDNYSKICKKQGVTALSQSDFLTACDLADSRGLLAIKKGKDTRAHQISLRINEKDIEQQLSDKILFSTIMQMSI